MGSEPIASEGPSGPQRIGILGGTFDPIHNGHLVVASAALSSRHLDRILFVPSGHPPHKRLPDLSPAESRARMVELAVQDDPLFELCRVELERPGPSYTVDTLRHLKAAFPGSLLFLIIGADNAEEMDTWSEPDEVVALATVLVVSRAGSAEERVPERLRKQMDFLVTEQVDISSTEIRQRVHDRGKLKDLVPAKVEAYILDRGLYV